MKKLNITPSALSDARKKLYYFTFLNIIAFTLLSGNLITLFSLRLGADSFLIGMLSFFTYISYLCMLIGRSLVKKFGVVGLMGRFWFARHLMMLPMLITPLIAGKGYYTAVYAVIIFSVLGFSVSRGIAITGYNPVIGEVTTEKQRGYLLSQLQKIQHAATLVVSIIMALVLGKQAPLYRYVLFIITGIICGSFASFVFMKIPEPDNIRENISENLWTGFFQALKRASFRKFIVIHFLISFATFMVFPFLIVYIKKIFNQPDNFILFYTVFGSLGAILMALISGFMIDRLGAKPLYFIFSGIILLAVIPTILSPGTIQPEFIWIFASAVFFFHNMGNFGVFNAGQTYFFSAIRAEESLNLGVMFFLIRGLASGIGALSGGIILEWLQKFQSIGTADVFRIYFGFVALMFGFIMILIARMENLGAYPIRNAMAIIFSPREIRTVSLLNRLDRSQTVSEEKSVIRALGGSKSELSIDDILNKLTSPLFTIRKEALSALSTLPVDKTVINALISEVKNHAFTTAYIAADIIGKRKIKESKAVLRKQLYSKDYILGGKCMVALANLNDRKSLGAIEDIIRKTRNPGLIVHGAAALSIFHDPASVQTLFAKLKEKNQPYMRDEIILSIAGILGFEKWFYPVYISFLENSTTGISHLIDFLSDNRPQKQIVDQIEKLYASLPITGSSQFSMLAEKLLQQIAVKPEGADISPLMLSAVKDAGLARLVRFRFLIAATITWFGIRRHHT